MKNKDVMFSEPVEQILYCYEVYQSKFDEILEKVPNISFHKSIPTELDSFAEGCKHNLVILVDLMDDVVRNIEM